MEEGHPNSLPNLSSAVERVGMGEQQKAWKLPK